MTSKEAGRRYLQAHLAASYTGLPDEARQEYEQTAAGILRRNPDARLRATVGTNQDFDERLSTGEREHQQRVLQPQLTDSTPEGIKNARQQLRGTNSQKRAKGARRQAVRTGVSGGRGYARARRAVEGSSGIRSTGSILLEAIGVAIGLSLLYLVLSSGGSKAFSTLLAGVSGFMRALIAPVDPLNPQGALKAATKASEATGAPYVDVLAHTTPTLSEKLKEPAFGPAPGIGSVLGGLG